MKPASRLALACFFAFLGLFSSVGIAKDKDENTPSFFDDFSALSIGAAFVSQPEFLGASESEFRIFPLLQGVYNIDEKQQIYLRGFDLGYAYAQNENVQYGLALGTRDGRDPSEDSRLQGLNDINTALEIGPWIKLRWKGFRLTSTLRADISGQHDGVLASFQLSHKIEPLPGIRLKAYAQTNWASNSFMDAFFSVTPGQATAGRPAFNAGSGFYQSALGGTFSHRLHDDIFVWVDGQYQLLHGDASKSSLSFDDSHFRGIIGLGYTF